MGLTNWKSLGKFGDDDRAAGKVIGLILLWVLVLLGGGMVALTGLGLIDQLSTYEKSNNVERCFEVFDHRTTIASLSGDTQQMPCDGIQYVDDGHLYLIWHDESPDQLPSDLNDSYSNTSVSTDVGTIEREIGGNMLSYQGGGIWKQVENRTIVQSTPATAYDQSDPEVSTLQLELVRIANPTDTSTVSSMGDDPNRGVQHSVDAATSNAVENGYNNLTIVIESKYYEGWQAYFAETIEDGIISTSDIPIEDVNEERAVRVDLIDVLRPTSETAEIVDSNAVDTVGEAFSPSGEYTAYVTHSEGSAQTSGQQTVITALSSTKVDIRIHEIVLE